MGSSVNKCNQAKDVHWLSMKMQSKQVIRSVPSLLVNLEREAENGNPTAHGLHKFMKIL